MHHAILKYYAVLIPVSRGYSAVQGRLFTRYSPVRHYPPEGIVRLACVRHAASVRPEPGSNSRLIFLLKITLSYLLSFITFLFFYYRTSAVSFTKFSAPCVAKFRNSLRLTYHRFFSPLRLVKSG